MALGQQLSAEQAAQIVVDEVGPCWSRWADDCMEMRDDVLQEHGLYADCQRLIDASNELSDEQWYGVINQLPYCEGFFDYARMPDAGGHPTVEPARAAMGNVVTGAIAVGMMLVGIVIGRATK